MKVKILSFFLFFFSLSNLFSQDTVSIMTYNLMNYGTSSSTTRNNNYKTIINYTKPDILSVQELNGISAPHQSFYNKVLNKSVYDIADIISDVNTYSNYYNALYFNKEKFKFISNKAIKTKERILNEYKLVNISSNDTIYYYVAHLAPSSGSADKNARATQIDSLRKVTDKLPLNSNFFVSGDFNIYTSEELAYKKLLSNSTSGFFVDPFSDYMTGTFNVSSYSKYHTQSTTSLDDRFDFLLFSDAINKGNRISYIDMIPVGNDGNHYLKSINSPTNNSVPDSVSNALLVSDHLPVLGRFIFKNANLPDIIPEDTVVVIPPDTIVVIPPDTIIIVPNDTIVITPNDSIIITPNDSIVITPNDSIIITPNDTLVVIPNETPSKIDTVAPALNFVVFPNPSSGEITLKLENPVGSYTVRIFDNIGRIVYYDVIIKERTVALKEGMYCVSLQDSQNKLVYKKLTVY